MAETSKAYQRRLADGWFEKYITGKVIDIGVGRIDTHDGADPVTPDCVMHDKDICDAHTMDAYEDNSFDCVHASHILEHLEDPITAIKNWFRILKPGGHLVISVPHRDLYEKKRTLPSRWNLDHKTFWLPGRSEPPCTFCLLDVAEVSLFEYGECFCFVHYGTVDTSTNKDTDDHANGEFSIELIIKKL
jgi:SAM-dependent methyltransferase